MLSRRPIARRWPSATVAAAVLFSSTCLAWAEPTSTAPAATRPGVPASQPASRPASQPASRPALVTGHDVYRQFEAEYRAGMVDRFRGRAKKEPHPATDPAAEAFLAGASRVLAGLEVDPFYRPADLPDRDRLVADGRAALAAGCDDPAVRYCLAKLLDDAGQDPDEAAELLTKSRRFLMAEWCPEWAALDANCEVFRRSADPAEAAHAHREYHNMMAYAAQRVRTSAGRRLTLRVLHRNASTPATLEWIVREPKTYGPIDPWLGGMLDGERLIDLAWKARGNGFANTVTPDRWEQFYAHLGEARTALVAAWKADPTLPEAPTRMIGLAAGGGDRLGEDVMTWFDRASAAQADHLPALKTTLTSIRPRWGGTREAMLRLSLSRAAGGRFDTLLPWHALAGLMELGAEIDFDHPLAIFRAPQVAAVADQVLDGYVAAGGPRAAFFGTAKAAVAVRGGRLADARKALDAVTAAGRRPDPAAFTALHAGFPEAEIGEVYARTGPLLATVARAEEQSDKGDPAAALRTLREVAAALPKGDASTEFVAAYLGRLAASADRAAKAAAGDLVPLPLTPVPHQRRFEEWNQAQGEWALAADGSVRGNRKEVWTMKILHLREFRGPPPEGSVEVAVKVVWAGPRRPGQPAGGGVVIGRYKTETRAFAELDLNRQVVVVTTPDGKRLTAPAPGAKAGSELRVRVHNRSIDVTVDGKPVGAPVPLGNAFDADMSVGLGGNFACDVRFADPRIRVTGGERSGAGPATP
ncbi:MAG TPA: hypothetical protein VF796_14445 [Humisphaera sp.]